MTTTQLDRRREQSAAADDAAARARATVSELESRLRTNADLTRQQTRSLRNAEAEAKRLKRALKTQARDEAGGHGISRATGNGPPAASDAPAGDDGPDRNDDPVGNEGRRSLGGPRSAGRAHREGSGRTENCGFHHPGQGGRKLRARVRARKANADSPVALTIFALTHITLPSCGSVREGDVFPR